MRARPHARMNRKQKRGRPAINAMDDKTPRVLFTFRAQRRPMVGDLLLVIVAPRLGAARGPPAETLGLDELDSAGVWEGFLRRVHYLHDMAARPGGGQLSDDLTELRNRRPEIGQEQPLPK